MKKYIITAILCFVNIVCEPGLQNWYEHEPTVGLAKQVKEDRLLSWHFSLWDFAPRKGAGVRIGIIDKFKDRKNFRQESFSRLCKKSLSTKEFVRIEVSHKATGDLSSKEIFMREKKSISRKIQRDHGACTEQIIVGLAPEASMFSYNIFDERGHGSSSRLFKALGVAAEDMYDIVHIGCKVTAPILSEKDDELFRNLCKKIPLIVAPAGNDVAEGVEAFPAKCPEVAFDVGSFDREHDICSFSQYELGIGPKIVMPGKDILIPILVDGRIEWVSLSGTSVSAGIMTAFLALILAEFKKDFTYQQLLSVLYSCTVKLKNGSDWNNRTILGTIDMRTSFFCLRILKKIKSSVSKKKFVKLYHRYLEQILLVNRLCKSPLLLVNRLCKSPCCCSLEEIVSAIATLLTKKKGAKDKDLNKIFDKKLLCLVKPNSRMLIEQNIQKDSRIRYALNRKH